MLSLKNLFEDNPLSSRWVVEGFWNRQDEIDWALDLLTGEDDFEKVCVIHGHTRTGKSHFAQRVLADPRLSASGVRSFAVNANNQGTARNVFESLLFALHRAVMELPPNGALQPSLDALREELREARLLLEDGRAERIDDEVAEASAELGAPTLKVPGLELAFPGRVGEKAVRGRKVVTRPLTDRGLAELVATAADAIRQAEGLRTVLLFIDDLDLLDREGAEGGAGVDTVVDLLRPIADREGLCVVATTRRQYFNGREKDFIDLGALRPMKPEELVRVYELRARLFNDGREIFSPGALALLTRTADGRVGVFLRHCREVFRLHRRREPMPFAEEVVRGYITDRVRELLDDPAHRALMREVIACVRAQRLEFQPAQDPARTGMLHVVLNPVPGRSGWYAVNPLFAEVLRDAPEIS
jgi:hypothetical protein